MPLEVSGLAGAANPYGAAIGAAAGVLNTALADTPTSVGGGAVTYQAGPFVVGSKQVGGHGNTAGATTATAAQTAGQPGGLTSNLTPHEKVTLYCTIAIAIAAIGGLLISVLSHHKKHHARS